MQRRLTVDGSGEALIKGSRRMDMRRWAAGFIRDSPRSRRSKRCFLWGDFCEVFFGARFWYMCCIYLDGRGAWRPLGRGFARRGCSFVYLAASFRHASGVRFSACGDGSFRRQRELRLFLHAEYHEPYRCHRCTRSFPALLRRRFLCLSWHRLHLAAETFLRKSAHRFAWRRVRRRKCVRRRMRKNSSSPMQASRRVLWQHIRNCLFSARIPSLRSMGASSESLRMKRRRERCSWRFRDVGTRF